MVSDGIDAAEARNSNTSKEAPASFNSNVAENADGASGEDADDEGCSTMFKVVRAASAPNFSSADAILDEADNMLRHIEEEVPPPPHPPAATAAVPHPPAATAAVPHPPVATAAVLP